MLSGVKFLIFFKSVMETNIKPKYMPKFENLSLAKWVAQ